MTDTKKQGVVLPESKDTEELLEFIKNIKMLSKTEKAEVRGYIACLRTIKSDRTA